MEGHMSHVVMCVCLLISRNTSQAKWLNYNLQKKEVERGAGWNYGHFICFYSTGRPLLFQNVSDEHVTHAAIINRASVSVMNVDYG